MLRKLRLIWMPSEVHLKLFEDFRLIFDLIPLGKTGELRLGLDKYDCTHENILLAGSYLFKGRDVYGIVIATGKDTKIRLKQNLSSKKSWYLQRRLNVVSTATLLFLLSFILLGTYGYLDNEPIGVEILQVVAIYFLLFNGMCKRQREREIVLILL